MWPGFEIAMRSAVRFPHPEGHSPTVHRRVRMAADDLPVSLGLASVDGLEMGVMLWRVGDICPLARCFRDGVYPGPNPLAVVESVIQLYLGFFNFSPFLVRCAE